MQIVLRTEECGGFVRYLPVRHLDAATRWEAQKRFNEYRLNGTVIDGTFESDLWRVTNQLHWFSLDFRVNEVLFRQKAEFWTGCTVQCYQECMKAYIAFQLGKYSLVYLQQIINSLKSLSEMNADEAMTFSADERMQVIGFLSLLPEGNDLRDQVIETLEELKWTEKSRKSRQLADFPCYLRFNRELDSYWSIASEEQKKFYFPVYFWWKLTAILPLRCTEFLLTPRDCIRQESGKLILSIRRTRLKKGHRHLAYAVQDDYAIQEYEIPSWMFDEIQNYQNATAGDVLPELGTLLVPTRTVPSGYFAYIQMAHRLRRFCKEAMSDENFPIHLGDTRHLAMINLMLSGGSPVICRELAGHESIDVSSNYYANLSAIVESVVYERYHGWTDSSMLQGSLRFPAVMPKQKIRVDQGWCDVVEVAQGEVFECLKCYSANGRIGDCLTCPHFYPESPGLRIEIEKVSKKAVDEDGKFLMQMIELVRKGLGYEEDIGSALLRLQGSAHLYGSILAKKYLEVGNNGET